VRRRLTANALEGAAKGDTPMLERFAEWSWELCLGLLAVAGTLLAIALARTDLETLIHVPRALVVGLTVTGIAVGTAGLLGIAALTLRRITKRDAVWCEFRAVSRANVREVHELMMHTFGEESPTTTRILEWQRRNSTVMTAVYIKRLASGNVTRSLVGVFKIVPLKAEGVALVEQERLPGGAIPAALVTGQGDAPAGFYIGDVLAVTVRAKGELLRQMLTALRKAATGGTPIYTRPLTADGARLVHKYGFVPVADSVPAGSLGRIHRFATARARRDGPSNGAAGADRQ